MVHKNNNAHCITWRHKSPENLALYREISRKFAKKSYDWKKIKMEFLRILL
jgi:hypothetical protein